MLTLRDVTLGYGKKVVVDKVDFELQAGEFVALVGANGAGKSTLMKTVVGLLKPLTGQVLVTLSTSRKNPFNAIGFSPQEQILDWYLNVYDNVLQGPLLAGLSKKEAQENALKALELLEIKALRKAPVDHISGGQQQRVKLAREIAKKPRFYLLDEPTTGLDVETSEKLFTFLQKESQAGALVLVSSHDLTLLENYAEKLIFLDEQEQKYFGPLAGFLTDGHSLREKYLTERTKTDGSTKI